MRSCLHVYWGVLLRAKRCTSACCDGAYRGCAGRGQTGANRVEDISFTYVNGNGAAAAAHSLARTQPRELARARRERRTTHTEQDAREAFMQRDADVSTRRHTRRSSPDSRGGRGTCLCRDNHTLPHHNHARAPARSKHTHSAERRPERPRDTKATPWAPPCNVPHTESGSTRGNMQRAPRAS